MVAMTIAMTIAMPIVIGQPAPMPSVDQDPFVGQWRANARESRPMLSKEEATYARSIQRDGDDLIFASSGGPSKAAIRRFRVRCDGRFHPLPTGPKLSCRYVASNRVEGETKDPTGRHSYWVREVSMGGQKMTISEYKNKSRTKLRSVMVLDRVR